MSIGEALLKEREQKKISLDFVSAKTNISLKALESLEREEIHDIPGEFYFVNYIKNYLQAIGSDADAFLKEHKQAIKELYAKTHPDAEPYCSKLRYSRFKKRNIYFSLFLTAVVFIAAFYLLYTQKEYVFSGWDSGNQYVILPQMGLDFTSLPSHDNTSPDYSPVRVAVQFHESCWAKVLKGGENITEATYKKGDRLNISGYNIDVSFGNPSGIRLYVNGKEVTYLRKLVNSERLNITPGTIKRILAK